MGVRIQDVSKEIASIEKLGDPRGALVASIAEDGPADKAGIQAGDIILEFDSEKIKEMKELPKIVAQTPVGKTVDVKIWRDKKEISKRIKLGRLETSGDFKVSEKPKIQDIEITKLKIKVRKLTRADIASRNLPKNTSGLVITEISPDSPINYLEINNIIIEAQKKKVISINQFNNIINSVLRSQEKTMLVAIINNQNQRRYIGIKLDQ